MNNIPSWLETTIYFVMAGLCLVILKYIYELVKIIRK